VDIVTVGAVAVVTVAVVLTALDEKAGGVVEAVAVIFAVVDINRCSISCNYCHSCSCCNSTNSSSREINSCIISFSSSCPTVAVVVTVPTAVAGE
jgi:hypothetical protein